MKRKEERETQRGRKKEEENEKSTPTQTIKYTSSLITCTIQYAYYVPLEKDPTNLFPFKMWGHYNELGYKKISERIYKNLSK